MAESGIVLSFAVGLLAICLVMKLLKLSIQLLLKFVSNSVCGALMLLVGNLFGLGIQITVLKALLVGIFGIPGVIVLVVWEKFLAG